MAVNSVREYIRKTGYKVEVVFCCFSNSDLAIYEKLLAE
jgi:hypothetical protein